MEPRLLRHGNQKFAVSLLVTALIAMVLQWSHVFSDMEIFELIQFGYSYPYGWLQWSHVFSDMEINQLQEKTTVYLLGFNGATSSQTWKYRMV